MKFSETLLIRKFLSKNKKEEDKVDANKLFLMLLFVIKMFPFLHQLTNNCQLQFKQ